MSEAGSRFGPDWDQPLQEQEEREEASSTSRERKEVVGRDGEFVLEENVAMESFLTDGRRRGRIVTEHSRRVRLLDCNCPYDEKVGAVRTPDGRWVCPKHYVGFCGWCQQELTSTVTGGYIYLPKPFVKAMHPHCAYRAIDDLFYHMRTHKDTIKLDPDILLTYQALFRQLKREFGLMARIRRAFSGR